MKKKIKYLTEKEKLAICSKTVGCFGCIYYLDEKCVEPFIKIAVKLESLLNKEVEVD